MITKEWLEQEIKILGELEIPATVRLADAERAFLRAEGELFEARRELESLRCCKKEFMWQMANMREGT